ncbi:MAG: hypothetical protein HYV40_04685 [Candidatus Levybacteria bacterium]|nr:hypothetical protein [Candidatus Levybacteria bacterium]
MERFIAGMHPSVLPKEAPDNIVVTPTMNRWKNGHGVGPLPTLLTTTQAALSREGIGQNTWMLVADASNQPDSSQLREDALGQMGQFEQPARMFFMTPETQAQVAQEIAERTGIRREIVNAILLNNGYASQRMKLDMVAGGLVLANGRSFGVLTADDDTEVREKAVFVKEDKLPIGLKRKPNSQTLFQEDLSDDAFETRPNRIGAFFEDLGKTVGEIRESDPGFRVTQTFKDTMHGELEHAREGQPAQFEVTHADEEDMPNADQARVIAKTATKHGVPDYRTVRIAYANFRLHFPEEEVPITSYPSGENKPFAFQKGNTNVDSAAFSRHSDDRTILLPWWYVSSLDISQANPLGTVNAHYRADNELLPVLLDVVAQKTGVQYLYMGGIDTQIYHNRARSGYRPGLHEQAAASLVGNIAALEASRRLSYDPQSGQFHMERVDEAIYEAPLGHAQSVYEELHGLMGVCNEEKGALDKARQVSTDPDQIAKIDLKVMQFADISRSIEQKLGGKDNYVGF